MSVDISFIIPVFNSAATLQRALTSVFAGCPEDIRIEVIVIDDGSSDPIAVTATLAEFREPVSLIRLEVNSGKAAAVNCGITASTGTYVIQLDSDDFLKSDWGRQFKRILARTNEAVDFYLSACETPDGNFTQEVPGYCGPLLFSERLAGKYRGEYLAIFRGDFIRTYQYVDLSIRSAGYEELSYLRFLEHGTCLIVPEVLRIYQRGSEGLSGKWWEQNQAAGRVRHLEALLQEYQAAYQKHAPLEYNRKQLRLFVYRILAGENPSLRSLTISTNPTILMEFLGCVCLKICGARFFRIGVTLAQRLSLLRRWG